MSILERAIHLSAAVDMLLAKGAQVSERTLAKEIEAYRQIGRAIFFNPEDLEKIMEPVTHPLKTPQESVLVREGLAQRCPC